MRTTSRPPFRATSVLLAIALTVLLSATACGSSDPTADPTPTDPASPATSGSPSPTGPPSTDAANLDPKYDAVLAAYQEFWRVYLEASDPPNPDDADLSLVATGSELDTVRAAIGQKVSDGTFTRLPPSSKYHHQVVGYTAAEPDRAVLVDCALDDARVIRQTGEVVNANVVTQRLQSVVINIDGRWKVESVQRLQEWAGEFPCVTAS